MNVDLMSSQAHYDLFTGTALVHFTLHVRTYKAVNKTNEDYIVCHDHVLSVGVSLDIPEYLSHVICPVSYVLL